MKPLLYPPQHAGGTYTPNLEFLSVGERGSCTTKKVRMSHSGGSSREPEQNQGVPLVLSSTESMCNWDQLWGGEESEAAGEFTGFLSVILGSCAAGHKILLVSGRGAWIRTPLYPAFSA